MSEYIYAALAESMPKQHTDPTTRNVKGLSLKFNSIQVLDRRLPEIGPGVSACVCLCRCRSCILARLE